MNQDEWNNYCNWYYNYYNPYLYSTNNINESYIPPTNNKHKININNSNTYIPPHKRHIKKKKMEINNFNDLVKLSNHIDEYYVKNIDIHILRKMRYSLNKLDNMIGLDDIKEKIFYQLIFFLQKLDNVNNDMLHTIIEGEPGLGKTELAKILGDIYCCLRNFNKFHSLKRSDLVGEYLGQTAVKTQKKLTECLNGVVFIDEAYSLGNNEKKDSYSKEAIDTITSFLSENKQNIIVIIAGYKDELNNCFFNYNKGLERRFPWRYSIDKYNSKELLQIFKYISFKNKWKIDKSVNVSFFDKNYDLFKNNGGDCEILFHKVKLIYSKKRLNNNQKKYKTITIDDLDDSLNLFKLNKNIDNKNNYIDMYS